MFEVRWAAKAVSELEAIVLWLAEQADEDTAHRVALHVFQSTRRLARFPRSGRPGHYPETYELVLPHLPYVLIYVLEGSEVWIVRCLHTAQLMDGDVPGPLGP